VPDKLQPASGDSPQSDPVPPDPIPAPARPAAALRPRTTLNLKEITAKPRALQSEAQPPPQPDRAVQADELKKAWNAYAELHRNQVAEYQLLNREISLEETQVVIQLANPFEEQLLQTVKTEATTFLRNQLQNNQITIQGNLVATEAKKMIYTNREKFEFLLDKHPALKALRDRFGLDADF
jgi:DNA polymerase-3 subunit gamma/tau